MWTPTKLQTEAEEMQDSGVTDQLPRAKEAFSTTKERGQPWMVAALAGGILLADAVRTAKRQKLRAAACALAGGALLSVGLRQRRTHDGMSATDSSTETQESAEAQAHLEQSDVLHQSETNPRGVSEEPDVETKTDPDDGDVQFTTEQDEGSEPKPHLDEADGGDPRVSNDGDHEEVNLSEAAMADEASEATGPSPEQAYPASEGTDPEPMSEEAPPRQGEGAEANSDADADSEDEAESESSQSDDASADTDEEST